MAYGRERPCPDEPFVLAELVKEPPAAGFLSFGALPQARTTWLAALLLIGAMLASAVLLAESEQVLPVVGILSELRYLTWFGRSCSAGAVRALWRKSMPWSARSINCLALVVAAAIVFDACVLHLIGPTVAAWRSASATANKNASWKNCPGPSRCRLRPSLRLRPRPADRFHGSPPTKNRSKKRHGTIPRRRWLTGYPSRFFPLNRGTGCSAASGWPTASGPCFSIVRAVSWRFPSPSAKCSVSSGCKASSARWPSASPACWWPTGNSQT